MPYEVGLIGATAIAVRAIVEPSRRNPAFRVAAVAASDPVRAAQYARTHGVERVHADYPALLADPGVDVVYVSLHNSAHHPWAAAAARAGKHVVVEKPICLSTGELADVRQAARATGVTVVEAVPTAGHPWQHAVRSMVAERPYGALRSVRTTMRFAAPRPGGYRDRVELGGGIFLDTASYWLQALQAVVGLRSARGTGTSAFDGPNGVDRQFLATLLLTGDVTAVLDAQVGDPHIAEHHFTFDTATVKARHVLRPTAGSLPLNLVIQPTTGGRLVQSFPAVSYYDRQLSRLAELLADGSAAEVAAEECDERVALMAAVYQSARRDPVLQGGRR